MIALAHRADDGAAQRPFTGVDPVAAHLAAFIVTQPRIHRFPLAGCGQISAPQHTEMRRNSIEHELVVGRRAQPRGDRHPSRGGHRFHTVPLPQLARGHAASPLSVSADTAARSRFVFADRCPYRRPAKLVTIASISRTSSDSADSSSGWPV